MLTHKDAQEIFGAVSGTKEISLKLELYASAIRYAGIRADWHLLSADERSELDDSRRRAHDSFIDSCNALSRAMAKAGEDNLWRGDLGDDRVTIGDFACYVHLFLGLANG